MAQAVPLSDDELLLAFQQGELRAYELIYERYWQQLYRHARGLLGNDQGAEDVVQEVFTTLWIKGRDAGINPPLGAFLYKATRNRVLDLIKHFKIEAKYLSQVTELFDQPSPLPDGYLMEKELADRIEAEIQHLPKKMREVFVKSRKEHKTHQQISEELSISAKTVKRQVSNALIILKNKLSSLLFNLF
ncbi:RNA polymerase sigma 70 [Pedobacter cryoconitis]|uniref:RNA polymerase sigma 70 n=1 Tax=Pedobacter cryoconitis TaxID=188932 RepID=A0A127VF46_9SPHI|nr:RNA polymerase sigma-70 factor [Pedobacter cryoconitis]AMP99810.1 RNA polymerase sigma 70 [Pedobacter cryoconitis]